MHEREPGLHKDDIIAIIRTYDEGGRGKWRTIASKSKVSKIKERSKSDAIGALDKLLSEINNDPATGNITDSDLLRVINCFAINNDVKYNSATFRALKSILSNAFPDRKDHSEMARSILNIIINCKAIYYTKQIAISNIASSWIVIDF